MVIFAGLEINVTKSIVVYEFLCMPPVIVQESRARN